MWEFNHAFPVRFVLWYQFNGGKFSAFTTYCSANAFRCFRLNNRSGYLIFHLLQVLRGVLQRDVGNMHNRSWCFYFLDLLYTAIWVGCASCFKYVLYSRLSHASAAPSYSLVFAPLVAMFLLFLCAICVHSCRQTTGVRMFLKWSSMLRAMTCVMTLKNSVFVVVVIDWEPMLVIALGCPSIHGHPPLYIETIMFTAMC